MQRLHQWHEIGHFFQLCLEELQSDQRNCEEILQRIQERGICTSFISQVLSRESVKEGLYFAENQLSDGYLQEIIRDFALCFGAADLDQQLYRINHFINVCEREYEQLRTTAQQEGQLSLNLSIFGGAALFILLL